MSVSPKEAFRPPEALPDSIIIPFQVIFNTMGEPLPEPKLSINLGGFVDSPVPRSLWIDFDARYGGSLPMRAQANFPVEQDVMKGILVLAERQISDMVPEFGKVKASAGKIIVEASEPGSAGLRWKLIFDEEKAMEAFRQHFSPDNMQSMHFLEIEPPDFPGRLIVKFTYLVLPSDRQAEKLFVPQVEIWDRYMNTEFDPMEVKHKKIQAFAQAVLGELGPIWKHRYNFQIESFAQNPKALKILEEENDIVLQTLEILARVGEASY